MKQVSVSTSAETIRAQPPGAIEVRNLVKEFNTEGHVRRVLDNVSFRVPMGQRMAILGRNGAGKSTLIQILAGVQRATSGEIDRGLRMSWPLALGGGFEGELTGYDNARFISRLYDANFQEVYEFINDFTEMGSASLRMPVRFYSSGMRMRLAFALSLAINFECLLIDEVLFVGDERFQKKCHFELFENRRNCAMIIAIHSGDFVRENCHTALVLKNGRGQVFDDLALAADIYHAL